MPKIPSSTAALSSATVAATAKPPTIDYLRAYRFHGLNLSEIAGSQAVADCPFCGREDKWYVSTKTGQWDCKVCMLRGNLLSFLQRQVTDTIGAPALASLATRRRFLDPATLAAWQVGCSSTTADPLVPGYTLTKRIGQVYRYCRLPGEAKPRLLPTPGIGHHLHGLNFYKESVQTIYLCEGPWDAMILWEILRMAKRVGEDGALELTGSESSSLLSTACVLAVPGAGTFFESWAPLFAGKHVVLLYDSDQPRLHKGRVIPATGLLGMKRVAGILARSAKPPASIKWLAWGPEGFDPGLPSGTDVSDLLGTSPTAAGRLAPLREMLGRIEPIPADWVTGRTEEAIRNGSPALDALPCKSWKVLRNGWQKALSWNDDLDRGLSICLAVIATTQAIGDPLWIKLIAPPSSAKSVLCEAFSVCEKYIEARSNIRGFHSGFKSDRSGSEDHSLVERVRGKTLVIKDGDTLLQSPNLGQTLSEIRDLYDRTSRPFYRNGIVRSYEGVLFTIILAGTDRLKVLDTSELGERFVDVVMIKGMPEETEREIGWQVINQAFDEMDYEANGAARTQETPEMQEAKRLTGGYIEYLRENANALFKGITVSDKVKEDVRRLAEFVSFMRTRPSKDKETPTQREFHFRLSKQLGRLTKALTAVLGKTSASDPIVMKRVWRTAMDTSRGTTFDICSLLYNIGERGASLGSITSHTGMGDEKQKTYLRFLADIGVVDKIVVKVNSVTSGTRWRLTPRITRLYQEVMKDA